MSQLHSTIGRLARLVPAAALALALPAVAGAQQRSVPAGVKIDAQTGRQLDLNVRPRGFDLFGLGDVGIQGSRGTLDYGIAIINYGLCGSDANVITTTACPVVRGRDNVLRGKGFALEFTAAAPRSEFLKIAELHPGVSQAIGGGFTAHYALAGSGFTGLYDFGPADRSVGRLFSGIGTTTGDRSCRDKSSALEANYSNTRAGSISVLAGSDCPETWGPNGFEGARPIPDSAFIRAYNASPSTFNFDFWKIPASERNNSRFLGSFSTYYEVSDHFSENLRDWGSVTPLGSGRPKIRGFPLGLVLRVDAFASTVPTLANAVYYQVQIINRSADIYGGNGVDYDSLYFGLIEAQTGGASSNYYYVPELGAAIQTTSGVNTNCNNPRKQGGIFGACTTSTARGFATGAWGVLVLKSPIGDMRNKYFTREGSPWYNPASPSADDTITFNHGHRCGFGSVCSSLTYDFSERSAFGYVTSRERDVLDGRPDSDFSDAALWRTFSAAVAGDARSATFNAYQPGASWDYDEDGTPDTLRLDSCHTNGCVRRWVDTLPGGQVNRMAGSGTGGTIVAGPFKLASRDTTSFVFAMVGGRDSLPFETTIANAIEFYMNFYAGAEPPPAPRITSVQVPSAESQFVTGNAPFVRINFSEDPETWVDQYLTQFATKIETDPAFRTLFTLNPGLPDSIRARARTNLAEVLIFRSCDNGTTWDATGDCIGDPAVDLQGRPIGPGWRSYGRIAPAAGSTSIPNTFTDANVTPGRTYVYSLLARSRGAQFTVRDSAGGQLITRILTITDTLATALASSGPTTARVYIPVTAPAGVNAARVTLDNSAGIGDVPVVVRLAEQPVAGTYTLDFANRFIITETVNNTTSAVTTRIDAIDAINRAVTTTGTNIDTLAIGFDTATYTTTGRVPVAYVGATPTGTTTTAGDQTITRRIINQLGFVAVRGTQPLFVSFNLLPDSTTPPALTGSENDPGFIVRLDNRRSSGSTPNAERVILVGGDTLNATVLNLGVVQLQEGARTVRDTLRGEGLYVFNWKDDAFGPRAPFTVDPARKAEIEAEVQASLNERAVADTGHTGARLLQLIATATGNNAYNSKTLVQAKFPFTLANETRDNTIFMAMVRRQDQIPATGDAQRDNTLLLGAVNDTLRVAIPENVWVPGDQIFVFEVLQRDSLIAGRTVVDATTGQKITVTDTVVTFRPLTLGCNNPRLTCNPVRLQTPGATAYRPYQDGERLELRFLTPYTFASVVTLNVTGATPKETLTRADLRNVRVVPNPYVVQSVYDEVSVNRVGTSRILFTGVPASGLLRVYSVSGQFLQQLTWSEGDLNGTGDLPYDLRTREGTDLATGLYIYVIDATGTDGKKQQVRGKFVVIR